MNDLIYIKLRDLFASSIPGEWGSEGSVECGTPVLRSTNFQNDGSIDYANIAYRTVPKDRLDKRRINVGTILIEKSGGSPIQPAGRVVYCNCDFNGTASNFIEILKARAEYCPQFLGYLLYYLYQTGKVLKYQQQTTGIINFKLNEYLEEAVIIPQSKSAQAKIAHILSTVDRTIEQTEALIAKQQRIKSGLMQDLLTRGIDEQGNLRSEKTHQLKDSPLGRIPVEWEVPTIGSLATHVRSGATPRGGENVYQKDGVLFLRSQNIHPMGLSLDEVAHISVDVHHAMKRSAVFSNDVLLNITGASIGRCCYLPDIGSANVNQHVCAIRFQKAPVADAQFLAAIIQSNIGQRQIALLNAGGNREGLNFEQVKSFIIPWPNDRERRLIANLLQNSKSTINSSTSYLSKLCALKTALMQDLLTGHKRVTALLHEKEMVNA